MQKAVLNIALLCRDADDLEPWMLRVAERICISPDMQLCGLVTTDRAASSHAGKAALHRAWFNFEHKLVVKPVEAEHPALDAHRKGLAIVRAEHETAVRALSADVIIDLTSDLGQSLPSDVATHGVWFLDFLGPVKGAKSVRTIADNDPFAEIALCRKGADADTLEVIASATLNTKFFASLNHLFLCEKTVPLLLRELKRVQQTGGARPNTSLEPHIPSAPGVFTLVRYGFNLLRRAATRFIEVQASRLHLRPGAFFLQTARTDLLSVDPKRMDKHFSSANEYFADPFLWEHEGQVYCFFEVYNYTDDTGYIAVGRIDENDELTDIRPAVKADYHMSFPFLFEREGTLYMMPEVCSQRRIETWKCVEFPSKWERVQTVLDDVIAADSSLARIGDDWWLFSNMSNDPFGEMSSELHLYKVDGPEMSKLTPHPLNPVVFDTRTARNGGRVIQADGSYYRISQDNSHGLYGYGVNAMKIDHISMEDYRESLVRKIEPDFGGGIIGSHHMDTRAGLVVMDVRKRIGGFRFNHRRHGPRAVVRHSS